MGFKGAAGSFLRAGVSAPTGQHECCGLRLRGSSSPPAAAVVCGCWEWGVGCLLARSGIGGECLSLPCTRAKVALPTPPVRHGTRFSVSRDFAGCMNWVNLCGRCFQSKMGV